MTGPDAVRLAVVALIAVVPLAFVVIVALIRGYTISVHLRRPVRQWRRRRDRDNP
jgi:hypothetical protein